MKLRFGSVCSGIEAATVAWVPLGWECAWVSEIEKFPCELLKTKYPNVPNLGDMTTIADRILSGDVEAPDILCGGTPCQAFSVAGLRRSLDDARGNLSLEFVRLFDAIDTVRTSAGLPPAICFWENVPGALNTKDNFFGCFLAGLAKADAPFEVEDNKWGGAGVVQQGKRQVAWRVLDAQHFGVPQRRRRVYVVASARDGFNPSEILFEPTSVSGNSQPSGETWKSSTGFIETGFAQYRQSNEAGTVRASGGSIGGGVGNIPTTVGTLTSCDLMKRVNNQCVDSGLLIVK